MDEDLLLTELYQNLSWEELELLGLSGDPEKDRKWLTESSRDVFW